MLNVMFIFATASAMARGLDIECGCATLASTAKVGWELICRDSILLIASLLVLKAGSAENRARLATRTDPFSFSILYNPDPETALGMARCGICHVRTNGKGGLNWYGKQLQGKSILAASLKSIEKLDADGDGFTNITKIKAGTLPGDPRSKP